MAKNNRAAESIIAFLTPTETERKATVGELKETFNLIAKIAASVDDPGLAKLLQNTAAEGLKQVEKLGF